jgi:hypothetical protein
MSLKITFLGVFSYVFGRAFPDVSNHVSFIFRVMQFKNNGTKGRNTTTILNFGNARPIVQVSLARTLAIFALLRFKYHIEIQEIFRSKTKR